MPAVKLSKTIKHATQGEARVARKLLKAAFARGYVVSIHDGGEWAVTKSCDLIACCAALCSTGDDYLTFRDKAKGYEKVGTAWLIWGNDEDGSELIADHSDNAAMCALVAAVEGKPGCSHESVAAVDGHAAYCKHCGGTTA